MGKKNPKIILLTGFLGSGKTTLLLKIIDYLSKEKKKCAIIINEIGDIGIDNRQMEMLGYEVHDLFGGCVCCTMRVTLQATINYLQEENDDLDYILFEPSGMADPASMIPSILNCGYTREEIHNVFIFDPLRVDLYRVQMRNLLENGLKSATGVVINKLDVATTEMVEEAAAMVKELYPDLPVYKMSFNSEGLAEDFQLFLLK